jgi:hypothetical protein
MPGPSKKKPCPTRRSHPPPTPFEGPRHPVYFDQLDNDELPKLLVEVCFNVGYPYTGTAFTLACVSKDFQRAVNTQSDACLDKLRSLYDDWRQKRTLWVHAFKSADPHGADHRPPMLVQPANDILKEAWDAQAGQIIHLFGDAGGMMVTRHINSTCTNRLRPPGNGRMERHLEEVPPMNFTWSKAILCNLAKEQCMVCTGAGQSCATMTPSPWKNKVALCVGRISYSGATMTFRHCCLEHRTLPVTLDTHAPAQLGALATASMRWVSTRPVGAPFESKQMLPVTDNDPVSKAVHLAACMAKRSVGTMSLEHTDVLRRLAPKTTDRFWTGPDDGDKFRAMLFLYPNIYAHDRDCFPTRMGMRPNSAVVKAAERMFQAREQAAASLRVAQENALFEMARERVMPVAPHLVEECEELVERIPLLSETIRVLAIKTVLDKGAGGSTYMKGRVDGTLCAILDHGILDRVQHTIERVGACVQMDIEWMVGDGQVSDDAVKWAMCIHPSYLKEFEYKQGIPEGFFAALYNCYKPGPWPPMAERYELTAMRLFDAIRFGSVKVSFEYVNKHSRGVEVCRSYVSKYYTATFDDCVYSTWATINCNQEFHLVANFCWVDDGADSRPFAWAKVRVDADFKTQVKRLEHLMHSELTEQDQKTGFPAGTVGSVLTAYKAGMHYETTFVGSRAGADAGSSAETSAAKRLRLWYDDMFQVASRWASPEFLVVAMHSSGMVLEHICCAIDCAYADHKARNLAAAKWLATQEDFCEYLIKRMSGDRVPFPCAPSGTEGAEKAQASHGDSVQQKFSGECTRYLNNLYEGRYMPTSPSFTPTSPQYDPGLSDSADDSSGEEAGGEAGGEAD